MAHGIEDPKARLLNKYFKLEMASYDWKTAKRALTSKGRDKHALEEASEGEWKLLCGSV